MQFIEPSVASPINMRRAARFSLWFSFTVSQGCWITLLCKFANYILAAGLSAWCRTGTTACVTCILFLFRYNIYVFLVTVAVFYFNIECICCVYLVYFWNTLRYLGARMFFNLRLYLVFKRQIARGNNNNRGWRSRVCLHAQQHVKGSHSYYRKRHCLSWVDVIGSGNH